MKIWNIFVSPFFKPHSSNYTVKENDVMRFLNLQNDAEHN